jgi:hypothetical protein
MGDFEKWDVGPKHAEPVPVERYVSRGIVRLIVWSVVILGLCAAAVLWIMNAR